MISNRGRADLNKIYKTFVLISIILSILNTVYILHNEFLGVADIKLIVSGGEVFGLAYYDNPSSDYIPYWVKLKATAINSGIKRGYIMHTFLEIKDTNENFGKNIKQLYYLEGNKLSNQIEIQPKSSKTFYILVKIWKRASFSREIFQREFRIGGLFLYFNGKEFVYRNVTAPTILLDWRDVGGGSFDTRHGFIVWRELLPLININELESGHPMPASSPALLFPKIPFLSKIIPSDYQYYWNISNLGEFPIIIKRFILTVYYSDSDDCYQFLDSSKLLRIFYISTIQNEILNPSESKTINLTKILGFIENFKEHSFIIKIRIVYVSLGRIHASEALVCYELSG